FRSVASAVDDRLKKVDKDPADRNIQPDGEGPASNLLVRRKAARQREKEGDEDHRQSDDRERYVRAEEHKGVGVPKQAGVSNGQMRLAVEGKIDQIRDQKNGRKEEG